MHFVPDGAVWTEPFAGRDILLMERVASFELAVLLGRSGWECEHGQDTVYWWSDDVSDLWWAQLYAINAFWVFELHC